MMKMQLKYAEEFLTKGRAGHWIVLSCHDDVLVVEDLERYPGESPSYYGTKLSNGKVQADTQGYVVFTRVKPVIDKNTRFTLT